MEAAEEDHRVPVAAVEEPHPYEKEEAAFHTQQRVVLIPVAARGEAEPGTMVAEPVADQKVRHSRVPVQQPGVERVQPVVHRSQGPVAVLSGQTEERRTLEGPAAVQEEPTDWEGEAFPEERVGHRTHRLVAAEEVHPYHRRVVQEEGAGRPYHLRVVQEEAVLGLPWHQEEAVEELRVRPEEVLAGRGLRIHPGDRLDHGQVRDLGVLEELHAACHREEPDHPVLHLG